jgi:hypothetical protein
MTDRFHIDCILQTISAFCKKCHKSTLVVKACLTSGEVDRMIFFPHRIDIVQVVMKMSLTENSSSFPGVRNSSLVRETPYHPGDIARAEHLATEVKPHFWSVPVGLT